MGWAYPQLRSRKYCVISLSAALQDGPTCQIRVYCQYIDVRLEYARLYMCTFRVCLTLNREYFILFLSSTSSLVNIPSCFALYNIYVMTEISPLSWTIPLQEEWWSLGAATLVLVVVPSGENSMGHADADDLFVKPASVVTQ